MYVCIWVYILYLQYTLCECVCVLCMYVCTYVCMHVSCMYVFIHVNLQCKCVSECIGLCLYLYMLFVYVYECMFVCVHVECTRVQISVSGTWLWTCWCVTDIHQGSLQQFLAAVKLEHVLGFLRGDCPENTVPFMVILWDQGCLRGSRHAHTCTHVRTHVHARAHTYVDTHTHTHTQDNKLLTISNKVFSYIFKQRNIRSWICVVKTLSKRTGE